MTDSASTLASTEDFDSVMDAATAHIKARIAAITVGGKAPLELQLPAHIATSRLDAIPIEVKDALYQYLMDPTLSNISTLSANISSAAQKAEDGAISPDDFDNYCDGQADWAVEQFTKALMDVAQNKLKEIGHEHPDWQSSILSWFHMTCDFLLGPRVWGKIFSFITKTVKHFEDWAGKVEGWFHGVSNDVTGWFSNEFGPPA
ncbi:hypothetical protein [Rhizobium leguminosarum]|uniref:hypothetical protein n=1 Tax=Rhizobium leguminosarum TaxID=384 RepID=UPI003ECDAE8C